MIVTTQRHAAIGLRRPTWRLALQARLTAGIHLLAWAFASLMLTPLAQAQEPAEVGGRTVMVVEVEGAVGPALTDYLRRTLEAAGEGETELVVLRMDTPGGLSSSMREIIRLILASPVPVATYVAPSGARAASAGTYILYASHLAAMAPGTNLGAATPVQMGGGGGPAGEGDGGEDAEEGGQAPADPSTAKAVNDAVAYIRSLAELRGRNADWAERAVREAESLSASAALEEGVIEIVAADLQDLLVQAHGRPVEVAGERIVLDTAGARIVSVEPDWRTRILGAITDPNIAYILLLLGIYGIIFEFWNPGTIFSGVIGAIALIVALFALNMLPINFAGVGLLLLGLALMMAEAFVPSFGILGIGGAAAFALGSLFMFEEVPGFQLSLSVVAVATLLTLGFFLFVLTAVLKAYRARTVSGDETLVGSTAEVLTWSGERGYVHVHGERWEARAAGPVEAGERVRIKEREGLVLTVEPDR